MTTIEREPIAALAVDPLAQTMRASAGARVVGTVIDLVCVLGFVAVAIVAFRWSQTTAVGWVSASLGVVCAVWILVSLARSGRTPGHAAVGTRTVSVVSGAPSGKRLIADAVTRKLDTFDITRDRDPVAPALAPFRFPATTAPRPSAGRRRGIRRPALVELDSGERLALETVLVIGRAPAAEADSRAHQWADLSRTLSKSHVRLEWDGEGLWATDLGSTNGTAIQGPDEEHPLPAWQRTRVSDGTRLNVGDRHLIVRVSP